MAEFTKIKKVYANGVATTYKRNVFFKLTKEEAEYVGQYPLSSIGCDKAPVAVRQVVKEKTQISKAHGAQKIKVISHEFDMSGFEVYESYEDAVAAVAKGNANAPKDADSKYKAGDEIKHRNFGKGTIESIDADADEIVINFKKVGTKILILSNAFGRGLVA